MPKVSKHERLYQEARKAAIDTAGRYGWDDECETCLVPARECGHRQPEREKGNG